MVSLPSRFSASHLEFLGLTWLSHHHECDFFDSVLLMFFCDLTCNKEKTEVMKEKFSRCLGTLMEILEITNLSKY